MITVQLVIKQKLQIVDKCCALVINMKVWL